MGSTMNSAVSASPRERLAEVRGSQAKADLKAQPSATRLREIAAEALRRVTSQKAAAAEIGLHQGRLSHKLVDGSLTLAQLESLEHTPAFCAEFGKLLLEEYGQLADPKDYIYKRLRDVEEALHEFKQFLESRVA